MLVPMPAEDNDQWREAKRQALRVLTAKAKARETITYKLFVRRIKALPGLRFHGDERLDKLLDEISLDEDKAGRGLISVLVVELVTDMPSDGFFELAAPRYSPGTGRREMFERERDAVYEAHAHVDD